MIELLKKTAVAVLCVAANGCTIGNLRVDIVDMNNLNTADSTVLDDAPPKSAAQVLFQWDF